MQASAERHWYASRPQSYPRQKEKHNLYWGVIMLECVRHLFERDSSSKNERQAFILKLSCGVVKELVPTTGNKAWQSISAEK